MPKLPLQAWQKPDSAAWKAANQVCWMKYKRAKAAFCNKHHVVRSRTVSASLDPADDAIPIQHTATKPVEQAIREKTHESQGD